MIKLKKISISNFMSVGKTPIVLDLDSNLRTIIQGNNLDTDANNKSTNGVGKSTIFQAIIFSLYGKGIESKMKTDQFVNLINQKKMVVELELEANNQSIIIKRGRKPSFVELYVDGETFTRDSMKNTEEAIQRIIGVPYEIFMSVYFLSPHKETFMEMTSADQRSYLESVLSLDTLVERATTLKSIKKDLSMEVKITERDLENAKSNKERAESNVMRLEGAVRGFEEKRSATISELKETILEASQIDFEHVFNLIDRIETSYNDLNDIKTSSSHVQAQIDSLSRDKKSLEKSISDITTFREKESGYLDGYVKQMESLNDRLSKFPSEEFLHNQKNLYNTHEHLISNKNDKIKEKDMVLMKIQDLENSSTVLLDQHDILSSGKCPYCEQKHVDDNKIDEISNKIDEIVKELEREDSVLDDLTEVIKKIDEQIDDILSKIDIDSSGDVDDVLSQISSIMKEKEMVQMKMDEPNPYTDLINGIIERDGEVDELSEKLNLINLDLVNKEDELSGMVRENSEKEEKIKDLTSQCLELVGTTNNHEVKSMHNEISTIQEKIEEETAKVNPYIGELNVAKSQVPNLSNIEESLDELKKDEVHVNYLIKLLTDPKSFVRKNIVDQYVPFLNKKINEYSEKLGLSHVSEINADMSVDIQYMGRDAGYFLMSQGERLRLNLSTAMAFRDLLRLLGKDFNLVMVDEYLDSSLDGDGMYKSFNFLKAKAPNVLMISHREELCGDVDQTMIVTKQHGFSSIEIVS